MKNIHSYTFGKKKIIELKSVINKAVIQWIPPPSPLPLAEMSKEMKRHTGQQKKGEGGSQQTDRSSTYQKDRA